MKSKNLLGEIEGTTAQLPNKVMEIILLGALTSVALYVRSLLYYDTAPIIFDLAYFVSVVTLSFILVRSKSDSFHSRFVIWLILWVLTIRMMIPLRLLEGIVSNYPDMIYELQIIDRIIGSGYVSTASAPPYSFNPILEILVASISIVSGASQEAILKYAGPFLGILTVVFLLGFNRSFLGRKDAAIATFLGASCFWFIYFDPHTVHQTLALVFLLGTLFVLRKMGTAWKMLSVLFAFSVVATHLFSSIIGTFFFFAVSLAIYLLARIHRERPSLVERATLGMPILFALMASSWLSFIAYAMFGATLKFGQRVIELFFYGDTSLVFPLTAAQEVGVPLWIRIVGDISVLAFAATIVTGFFLALMKRQFSRYRPALPFAAASAAIFILGLVAFTRLTEARDLLPRGFIYVYFFAAPLSLLAITKASSYLRAQSLRPLLCASLLILVALGGAYYNYPRFLHDNTSQMDIEDVRFPLQEWKSAGLFARDHIGQTASVRGDKIAFSYVGGYGEKDVGVGKFSEVTLGEWARSSPKGSLFVLRESMPDVPYYPTNEQGFHGILDNNNILYFSGEVIMMTLR